MLAIDRSSPGFELPDKGGVGLARKIGSDVALAWYHQGALKQPWWLSTDGDAILPADVVAQLHAAPLRAGVACWPFEHVGCGEPLVDEATFALETKLRYHVLGLRYARSPYAWHALGSAMAIHVDAYAAVRGFPKRQAGEDFYLLQKASKLAPVFEMSGQPIRILARRSQRTPFGTGAEVGQLEGRSHALTLRHPQSYVWLGRVLALLEEIASDPDPVRLTQWYRAAQLEDPAVATTLQERGMLSAWPKAIRAATTAHARRRRIHEWFDGLRTIQTLNALQDVLPALPWMNALQVSPFVPEQVIDGNPNFATLAARLRALEAARQPPVPLSNICGSV